jgi:hypothetical protein
VKPEAGASDLPRLPASPLSPFSYRGEQTCSEPALEFTCPHERFVTEKLFVLYRYSILSLQRTEIMHMLRPPVVHNWEGKKSCIPSRSVEVLLALCIHRPL